MLLIKTATAFFFFFICFPFLLANHLERSVRQYWPIPYFESIFSENGCSMKNFSEWKLYITLLRANIVSLDPKRDSERYSFCLQSMNLTVISSHLFFFCAFTQSKSLFCHKSYFVVPWTLFSIPEYFNWSPAKIVKGGNCMSCILQNVVMFEWPCLLFKTSCSLFIFSVSCTLIQKRYPSSFVDDLDHAKLHLLYSWYLWLIENALQPIFIWAEDRLHLLYLSVPKEVPYSQSRMSKCLSKPSAGHLPSNKYYSPFPFSHQIHDFLQA